MRRPAPDDRGQGRDMVRRSPAEKGGDRQNRSPGARLGGRAAPAAEGRACPASRSGWRSSPHARCDQASPDWRNTSTAPKVGLRQIMATHGLRRCGRNRPLGDRGTKPDSPRSRPPSLSRKSQGSYNRGRRLGVSEPTLWTDMAGGRGGQLPAWRIAGGCRKTGLPWGRGPGGHLEGISAPRPGRRRMSCLRHVEVRYQTGFSLSGNWSGSHVWPATGRSGAALA